MQPRCAVVARWTLNISATSWLTTSANMPACSTGCAWPSTASTTHHLPCFPQSSPQTSASSSSVRSISSRRRRTSWIRKWGLGERFGRQKTSPIASFNTARPVGRCTQVILCLPRAYRADGTGVAAIGYSSRTARCTTDPASRREQRGPDRNLDGGPAIGTCGRQRRRQPSLSASWSQATTTSTNRGERQGTGFPSYEGTKLNTVVPRAQCLNASWFAAR